MADVQLVHLWQRGNWQHVVVGQAVTGINLQSQACRIGGRFGDTLQLFELCGIVFSVGIATRVDFDIRRAHLSRGFDLFDIRINKQRNQNARIRQTFAGITHFVALTGHIQAAFGGDFLTFFRYQAAEVRFGVAGNRQHLFGNGHLQIHAGIQRLTQDTHITVGNVAAIFTKVNGNAVSASLLGDKCRLNRIGISRAARITQRSDVINVDA